MRATFNVMFFVQKGKCKADGTAPILARLTVNQEKIHFSTKQSIDPQRWDAKRYRTLGVTKAEKNINGMLDELQASIQRHFFDLFIDDYEKLVVTQDYGHESFFRYKVCKDRVVAFVNKEYKTSDLPLSDISKRFLDKLYLYLRSERKLNNNTAVKFMHRFSTVFKMARDNGWVNGDPFKLQKLHLDKVDRSYLNQQELETIMHKECISLFCRCFSSQANINKTFRNCKLIGQNMCLILKRCKNGWLLSLEKVQWWS